MPLPYWAEWAGLAATLIALGVTIWQSVRARKASELARKEVLRFRGILGMHDLAALLGSVVEALDEIRKQGTAESPAALQDRCARLRRLLSELAEAGSLSDNERAEISGAQVQVARLSDRLAEVETRPFRPEDRADFDRKVMAENDRLTRLMARLRRSIGEDR